MHWNKIEYLCIQYVILTKTIILINSEYISPYKGDNTFLPIPVNGYLHFKNESKKVHVVFNNIILKILCYNIRTHKHISHSL